MQNEASSPAAHILVVDDDEDVLKAASLLLPRHGMRVTAARGPAQTWSILATDPVDVILLDLNFARGATSGEEGFRHLSEIMTQNPDAVVVVITGHSGLNIAVAAMRAGASDFVMKPWSNDRLIATLRGALELRRRRSDARTTGNADRHGPEAGGGTPLLGESPAMHRVRDLIRRIAPTNAPVLIYGEAGSGKSLIARNIHLQSARSSGPFICVELRALAAAEAERALFGDAETAGAFAEARGGSLFLDEVRGLAPSLQTHLLAALERPSTADIRVISATRGRRDDLREGGGLRDDLLYRLNTVEIVAPPLAARGDDALELARHFLRLYARRHGRPERDLAADAAEAILRHVWPGDVRALGQAMERCVLFAEGERYELGDLPLAETADGPAALETSAFNLSQSERALISSALKRNGFNVSHAARQLGLSRAALYRRMAKHGL